MALGAALASGFTETLLLCKAVMVAVYAPDQVLPSPAHPGVAGLMCTYISLTTSLCSSLVTGMLIRYLIMNKGKPAGKTADEETGQDVSQPLLTTSWERPENNKRIGEDKSSTEDQRQEIQPGTVLELVKLSTPDTPVLLIAFVFGAAAALMAACVPYYTGLIIDYASIDPDRWVVNLSAA